jgi:hypothetical protein
VLNLILYQWLPFQNFSFGTASLDLKGKAGFRPLFPRAGGESIGFWNSLSDEIGYSGKGFH